MNTHWLLKPPSQWTKEEQNLWRQQVYIAPAVHHVIPEGRWVLLFGRPQCGKTVLMQEIALSKEKSADTFVLSLTSSDLLSLGTERYNDHKDRLIWHLVYKLEKFWANPEYVNTTRAIARKSWQFLYTEYMADGSSEDFEVWVASQKLDPYFTLEASALTISNSGKRDFHLVVRRLIVALEIIRKSNLLILLDCETDGPLIYDLLKDLEILEQFQLTVMMTLSTLSPSHTVSLSARVRSRITLLEITWDWQTVTAIMTRALQVLVGDENALLTTFASKEALKQIQLVCEREYISLTPQIAMNWVRSLWYYYQEFKGSARVKTDHTQKVLNYYYTHYLPLEVDIRNQEIWRGDHRIQLTKKPLKIFFHLVQVGHPTIWQEDSNLMELAKSDDNLYQQVSRIRKEIEPNALKKPIYLIMNKTEGYSLQNVLTRS